MDVILLERVEKLGAMGDVVAVKPGYARNFLLPQGKALRVSKANLARFEAERAALEARNAELRAAAEAEAKSLDGLSITVIRQASDAGSLYGSVTTRDVADQLIAEEHKIDRRKVSLENPIKDLGLHAVYIVLHPEVTATVTVNVARSEEEAALQAQGKSIAELRAEEEAAEAAEFDVGSLFDPEADISFDEKEELQDVVESANSDDDDDSAKA